MTPTTIHILLFILAASATTAAVMLAARGQWRKSYAVHAGVLLMLGAMGMPRVERQTVRLQRASVHDNAISLNLQASKAKPEALLAKREAFVASSISTMYHAPDCRYVGMMEREYVEGFASEDAARATGRTPCKYCLQRVAATNLSLSGD